MSPEGNEIYRFGPYSISSAERVLRRGEQIVPLTPKCVDTLLALARHGGKVVDKETLMRSVWPDAFVEEGNLAQNIFTLRKTLAEDQDGARYIQTIPKRGYRLVVSPPEPVSQNAPAALEPSIAAESPRSRKPHSAMILVKLAVAAAAIAVCGLAGARLLGLKNLSSPDIRIAPLTVPNSLLYAILSPDGAHIAYVSNEAAGQSLWLRPTAGLDAGVRLAGPLPGHIWGVAYAPAGDSIYYLFENPLHPVAGALYRIPSRGGQPVRLLTSISGAPSVSPDGQRLIFKRYEPNDRGYLLMAPASGGDAKIVAESAASYAFNNYQWSADGKSVYYVEGNRGTHGSDWSVFELSGAHGPPNLTLPPQSRPLRSVNWIGRSEILALIPDEDTGISQIWRLRAAAPPQRLTNGLTDYTMLSATADAHAVLANSLETQDSVWIASADPGAAPTAVSLGLPAGSYNDPVWTSDGRVVYVGQSNIWLATADGAQRKPLLATPVDATEPVVSAGGRFVLFVRHRAGATNLWRVSLEGGDLRQVTSGALDRHPNLSPDGKWVAYSANLQGQWGIWKAPVDGGGPPVRLVDSFGEPPTISPDSGRFAFVNPAGEIQVRDFGGGSLLRSLPAPGDSSDLAWSSDGAALTYVSRANGAVQLWRQPLEGAAPSALGEALPADAQRISWSSRGDRIVYLRRELKVDLALITNFR